MNNDKVSVIIPARNEIFLAHTIKDILRKRAGDLEIITVLDGYWPDPPLRYRREMKILHRGHSFGMRAAINTAVAVATGKYIMKLDGHCLLSEGFDVALKTECDSDWVVIPRRYSLDAKKWECKKKPPIDYMYLSFPDNLEDWGGAGFHGKQWNARNRDPRLTSVLIDDAMSFQGSAWFMHKKFFHYLDLMDEIGFGPFWQEAQEIGPKCWFAGGRVVRNKKCFYAHLHKGKQYGRGYYLSKKSLNKGVEFSNRFMLDKRVWNEKRQPGRDLEWLVEKFWPIPTWPDDWRDQIAEASRNITQTV